MVIAPLHCPTWLCGLLLSLAIIEKTIMVFTVCTSVFILNNTETWQKTVVMQFFVYCFEIFAKLWTVLLLQLVQFFIDIGTDLPCLEFGAGSFRYCFRWNRE